MELTVFFVELIGSIRFSIPKSVKGLKAALSGALNPDHPSSIRSAIVL